MVVFFFVPSVNGSYWVLTVLAAQLYMLMYIILFASAICLRFKHPDTHRPFKIPGKKAGIIIVCSAGIIAALTTFIIGFIPPNNIAIGGNFEYESLLIGGLLLMGLPPFIIYRLRYSLITKNDLQTQSENELKENAYE
jgi:amino acid transporter